MHDCHVPSELPFERGHAEAFDKKMWICWPRPILSLTGFFGDVGRDRLPRITERLLEERRGLLDISCRQSQVERGSSASVSALGDRRRPAQLTPRRLVLMLTRLPGFTPSGRMRDCVLRQKIVGDLLERLRYAGGRVHVEMPARLLGPSPST